MSFMVEERTNTILRNLAETLDIPPHKYREAVDRYESVGRWLKDASSPLARFAPDIYPQGSFRLGTVVRPLGTAGGDYDIDLVCELHRNQSATPRIVKHDVGDRLMSHGTYRRLLKPEGRRCWTLVYAEDDGIGFHLDVLPCVPADATRKLLLEASGGDPALHRHTAVAVTHNDDPESSARYEWTPSNPRGYAAWFDTVNADTRVRVELSEKQHLFTSHRDLFERIEDVPDALVRTPLQRSIQILKRHRDARFDGHDLEDEKPISMIITTLAALAYEGEEDVYGALLGIIGRIEDYSTSAIIQKKNGKWEIPNPVQRDENFADRWNDPGSRCAEAFFLWAGWVREDVQRLAESRSSRAIEDSLRESFGDDVAGKVARQSRELLGEEEQLVPTFEGVPALGDISHAQEPPWRIVGRQSASIRATIHRSRHGTYLGILDSIALSPDQWLRFEIITDVSEPYETWWQVVNTGGEAIQAGQLRGDFYTSDDGKRARWERTAYAGTHWVEAFIVKNGNCLGRTGRTFVPIRSR